MQEGNKATLTVYNYTACTPTIEVDGVVVEDMTATIEGVAGDSIVIELDAGTYDISAEFLSSRCVLSETPPLMWNAAVLTRGTSTDQNS